MGKKRKKKLNKQQQVMGKHEANLDRATHELDEAIDLLDDGQFIKGAAKGFGAIGRSVKEIASDPIGFAVEWIRD